MVSGKPERWREVDIGKMWPAFPGVNATGGVILRRVAPVDGCG
jgi:hypothetical protein